MFDVHFEQVVRFYERCERAAQVGCVFRFDRAVAHFAAADCTPRFVFSDALDKQFRYRVKRQFARLCDHDIACVHQQIR